MDEQAAYFLERALQIHGEKYDYSLVAYKNVREKVKIICKTHGLFEQSPTSHINSKAGCPRCYGNVKSTTGDFITKAKRIHGDSYDYSLVDYINNTTKITIICPKHGKFSQSPSSHTFHKAGCPICSVERRARKQTSNTKEFIEKARNIHLDKYNYSLVDYVNNTTKVNIICPEHGTFWQQPNNHLDSKSGCPGCAGNIKATTEEFIEKAKEIHPDKYCYSKVDYINTHTKITIICPKHGEFEQKPNCHISLKQGCPKCVSKRYSNICIAWLDAISGSEGITIRHAKNGGEFKIPGSRFSVDGYCAETNTVYEFYGDYWHGNPKVYPPHILNDTKCITMGELYQETIAREQEIKKLGYNVISIWEGDWNDKIRETYSEIVSSV